MVEKGVKSKRRGEGEAKMKNEDRMSEMEREMMGERGSCRKYDGKGGNFTSIFSLG